MTELKLKYEPFLSSLVLFVALIGCTTTPKLSYRDLELPAKINANPSLTLTNHEVTSDKAQLIHALNSAYSGRKFLPHGEFEILLNEIEAIQGPLSAIDFCHQIDRSFSHASDNHLAAQFNGKHCSGRVICAPQVGPNSFQSNQRFWDVRTKKIDGVSATLISILSFPSHKDKAWKGFIDSVKASLPQTQVVILDLRGNGGGDDTKGHELAQLLAGANLKTPYLPQWTSNTPESMQLFVNAFSLWEREYKEKNMPVPSHIELLKSEFLQKRNLAIQGKMSNRPFARDVEAKEEDFGLTKSVNKPVYILMDAQCKSSCESTIDAFESNQLVKLVGENTAGFIHFGNNGLAVLRNSGIVLRMAVSYNQYKDGRFLEREGISPDVKVPPGQDALIHAIHDFKAAKASPLKGH